MIFLPKSDLVRPHQGALGPARRSSTLQAGLTAQLTAGLTAALLASSALPAWGQQSPFPVTEDQRQTADKVAQEGVAVSELAPNAPERYTIKKGDTLWAISILYLKSPWRWPALWGMNKTQISNPHLIFPGQMLVLVRTPEGRAILRLAGTEGTMMPAAAAPEPTPPPAPAKPVAPPIPAQKLEPRIRDLGDISAEPIPSIPNRLIEPFLSQPMIVSVDDLSKYPRIVATPEDRVFLGRGDQAYARGIDDQGQSNFHIFRPAKPLFDPGDVEHKNPIAYEAHFLGSARVVHHGEVTTLAIIDSRAEIGVQDRLVPIEHEPLITYAPHSPKRAVEGWLISVYDGIGDVGAQSIVTLDRGARDGLDIGTVLAVNRSGKTVRDDTAHHSEYVKLPDERIGQMFVFRVFDRLSYALVMTASGPIKVGDRFSLPDVLPDSASSAHGASVAVAR
ncbi:MAG TPA: LysM peptidoglycan-binding domain-containing protein [Burkholderiaceae bacterium]|jgi:nucleoid-associated protein YgaU|nr:LysM peptidoglycan-binding domain-containing protein [Burkholderiaceae bacterium]